MKVYHASSVVVERPDTEHSRSFLDFGRGFYVTTLEQQAIDYGQRFIRRGREAWLNHYEMCDDFSGWKVLSFDAYNEEWLDFVSELHGVSLEEAMDIFYNSPLLPLIEDGTADLHCRSDRYLAEEIWNERN